MPKVIILGLILIYSLAAQGLESAARITQLRGEYRDGQVFLQWAETETPAGTTFNVYMHSKPITASNLAQAEKIGHHVERHSARDWFKDYRSFTRAKPENLPASFMKNFPSSEPVGFIIADGATKLNSTGGLFVHTVSDKDQGNYYYAVTRSGPDGKEDKTLVVGHNTLERPIHQQTASVQAIWIGEGQRPVFPPGLPVNLLLHSRGGGTCGPSGGDFNFIAFGGAKHGWREGLPFKFHVSKTQDALMLYPSDRAWTGRIIYEDCPPNEHEVAINTFWYGYNSHIYDADAMQTGIVVNYTEEILLWMIDWAQRAFNTDPERIYIAGSSMGGCGSIFMALHHPEVFAAVYAAVPFVSYTLPLFETDPGNVWRLEPFCGPLAGGLKCNAGIPVLEHLNGIFNLMQAKDLPFIYIINGRTDGSIPWFNNPPFYKALNHFKQGTAIFWNNENHGNTQKNLPEDVRAWWAYDNPPRQFRRNQSYPAFSNCSANRNPGDGDADDGDLVGWINRGLKWDGIVDTESQFAINISAYYPGIEYPVTVDMTLRRLQKYATKPGETARVTISGMADTTATVDDNGLLTVKHIVISSKEAVGIKIQKQL